MFGDVNADGSFNNQDVFYATRILVGDIDVNTLTSDQLNTIDGDRNGVRESLDIQYLSYVAAKKYRFLEYANCYFNIVDQDRSEFIVDIKLLDQDSVDAVSSSSIIGNTRAFVEVKFGDAGTCGDSILNGNFVSGALREKFNDRHVLITSNVGNGIFQSRVLYLNHNVPNSCNQTVDFVVMVETEDVFGNTDEQRAFPFFSTDYGRYGAVGFQSFSPFGSSLNATITGDGNVDVASTVAPEVLTTTEVVTATTAAPTLTTASDTTPVTTSPEVETTAEATTTTAPTVTDASDTATTTSLPPIPETSSGDNTIVFAAAGAGGAIVLILMIGCLCLCRRKRKKFDTGNGQSIFMSSPQLTDGESVGISMQSLDDSTTTSGDSKTGYMLDTPGPEEGIAFDDEVETVGRFGIGTSPSFTHKGGKLTTPMYLTTSEAFQTPKNKNKEGYDPDDVLDL